MHILRVSEDLLLRRVFGPKGEEGEGDCRKLYTVRMNCIIVFFTKEISLSSMSSRPILGPTQPPIQWALGALSPGVKRPGREADHSPPTGAEVKKTWIYIYISTASYAFMA
jgi:hypothetical protein